MNISPTLPLELSAGLSLVNALGILLFLPETGIRSPDKHISLQPLHFVTKYFRVPRTAYLLTIWFCILLGFTIFQSVFPLYLKEVYMIPETESGFVLMWVGVWIIVNQTVLLRRFWLHLFTIDMLIILGVLGMIVAYALLALVPSRLVMMALLVPVAIFSSLLRPVFQQKILSQAPLDSQGEMNGVLGSLMNIGMVVAPLIGGAGLAFEISPFALSLVVTILALVILVLAYRRITLR